MANYRFVCKKCTGDEFIISSDKLDPQYAKIRCAICFTQVGRLSHTVGGLDVRDA